MDEILKKRLNAAMDEFCQIMAAFGGEEPRITVILRDKAKPDDVQSMTNEQPEGVIHVCRLMASEARRRI